jgi:hypothetical protein
MPSLNRQSARARKLVRERPRRRHRRHHRRRLRPQRHAHPGGSDSIAATIAGLTIRGTATGSAVSDDFFGITAESIRKAKIGGMALGLTLNKDDLLLDPANGDFRLVEV